MWTPSIPHADRRQRIQGGGRMSTRISYQGLGNSGYLYGGTDCRQGTIILIHEKDSPPSRDSGRGSIHVRRWECCCGGSSRLHRIGSRRSGSGMRAPEIYRRICGMAHPICVGLADAGPSCSNAFPRYVIDVSRPLIIQDVACYPVITRDSVKGIRQTYPVVRSTRPSFYVEY